MALNYKSLLDENEWKTAIHSCGHATAELIVCRKEQDTDQNCRVYAALSRTEQVVLGRAFTG